MGMTSNADTHTEEYFVGAKKILSVDTKTSEITYHDLPVKHTMVYAVFETTDDRGSEGKCRGYFSSKPTADQVNQGVGWYGGNGIIKNLPAIEISNRGHTSVYILADAKPIDLDKKQAEADEELRQKTLSNLTDEQIRVLGLNREFA